MKGLTSSEAAARLKSDGYNQIESKRKLGFLKNLLDIFKEPMFILLVACGALYILLGDLQEGIILLSSIILIISITIFQSSKTEKALDELKKLSSPRALVIRDNLELRIPGNEVVVGDHVIVTEGDRIPADGLLLETNHLLADESLLTGESMPVAKSLETEENQKLYSGSLVVKGRALILITSTGQHTLFGKIGKSLESIESQETRLQKEMKSLIKKLFIIGAGISICVSLLFFLSRGNLVNSILNGLAAAMAILPEEFPVVLTVFLALGAWRLSKVNTLTRNPSAIETLGSATVLCSDKTGTITQNKMEVMAVADESKEYEINSSNLARSEVQSLLKTASLASSENSVDPMEQAFHLAIEKAEAVPVSFSLVKEYPFNKEELVMTRVYKGEQEGRTFVFCKGAPESIFALCYLSETRKIKAEEQLRLFAEKGYRVIGVATSTWENPVLPSKQGDFPFTYLGLLALEDPIRPEVPSSVKECLQAGVKVVMITGDFPATAKSIGNKIGLDPNGLVISGSELEAMKEEELDNRINDVTIFARVVPEQKLRIVNAFKRMGQVVAMTGDGVNDAPALKAADIGIAMGKKGTDVAREASSLVLLDDNFKSIISAIRMGRKIYDNLQKAMAYIIAIHIPIIGLTILPAINPSLPLFLLPLHIVVMEMLIDPASSVVFESEQEELMIMNRAPRSATASFFGGPKIILSALRGLLLLLMVLFVYFISLKEGHNENEIRAISFSALLIGNIFLIISSLSTTRNFFQILGERNKAVWIMLTIGAILLICILMIPYLQTVFHFGNPGFSHFIISLGAATGMVLVLELAKTFNNRPIKKR